jgi:hypothetical protein
MSVCTVEKHLYSKRQETLMKLIVKINKEISKKDTVSQAS